MKQAVIQSRRLPTMGSYFQPRQTNGAQWREAEALIASQVASFVDHGRFRPAERLYRLLKSASDSFDSRWEIDHVNVGCGHELSSR
jgi:hypothetical protein